MCPYLTPSRQTPMAHSVSSSSLENMHGRKPGAGELQVPQLGLHKPMLSHPLLFHWPSRGCLVLAMHVKTGLHPSHPFCKRKTSLISQDQGKEENQAWGDGLVSQLSSLQIQGLEPGAPKPCETISCAFLQALVTQESETGWWPKCASHSA